MTNRDLLTAIMFAQDISILIALIVWVITPKAGRREFFWLGLALLLGFLTDTAGNIAYFIFNKSANSIIAVGAPLATCAYFLFYKTQFKSRQIQFLIVGLLAFFIVFTLINIFFIQGAENTISYSFLIRSVGFILISILYFYTLIKELPTESITKLPMFWINTGVLLYFSGVFFHWLSVDYLINVLKSDVVTPYMIKTGLGIPYYLLIALGLWHNKALYLPSRSNGTDSVANPGEH